MGYGVEGIANDGQIIVHNPVFKELVGDGKLNIIPLNRDDLDGSYPGFKVLLTNFFFNNIRAFFPNNIQRRLPYKQNCQQVLITNTLNP
jgi:hypothetical protein